MPTIDFDAFRAERSAEPVLLKLGGKVYTLPPSLPASVALDLIRIQTEQGGQDAVVPPSEVALMARRLLGDAADEILDRLGLDEIEGLVKQLLPIYAPSPNRKARRATKSRASR